MDNIKFSEFLVKLLEKLDFSICFGVTGAFSMYLNNDFGRSSKIKNVYNHHEQASIFAAIGYSKYTQKIPIVSVTAGCGVTNTITGIMDCWQDSVSCLIISGQTNSKKTLHFNKPKGLSFRHYSGQDVDIVDMVKNITKFSYEFNYENSVEDIINVLINSMTQLFLPRYGPVLLSIPLDIQSLLINDYNEKIDFIVESVNKNIKEYKDTFICDMLSFENFYSMIKKSKKPLILVGGGIKSSLSKKNFLKFINDFNIPVVSTYSGIDTFSSESKLYQGRVGICGERCGNYTIQQCDLLIIMGSRVSETTIGYNEDLFNKCTKIFINIDDEVVRMKKINCDLFIKCDLYYFLQNVCKIEDYQTDCNWLKSCDEWKKKYFYEKPNSSIITDKQKIKPYDFFEIFSDLMPKSSIIIPAAASIFYVLRHMIKIKENTNIIINSQQELGYELPCAIGSYFGMIEKNEDLPIFCFNGDGSFQFNIQELQTIKHHNIPLKIIIFNNNKYGCIEVTQKTYFGEENIYGIDINSGLSFPDFKKISYAYDIDYLYIDSTNIEKNFEQIFSKNSKPILIEINAEYQDRHPKIGVYVDENGNTKPTPFDKMNPQINI